MPMVSDGEKLNDSELTKPSEQLKKQPPLQDQVTKKKSLWPQCLMSGVIVLLVTGSGMPIGFSAILLPQIQAPDSLLPTDDDCASWIASVHSIMTPVGSMLAGPLMDRYGRRRVLQLSTLPMVFGWLLMGLAPNHVVLGAGRMMAGFAVGMTPGTSQVLLGEVAEPRLRGLFSSSPGLAYSLGILIVYALGSLLTWRVVTAVATVFPITGLFLLAAMPESPVWLVNQGRTDKARKSLLWLRGGDTTKVNQEIHLLVVHHKAEMDKRLAEEQNKEVSCNILPEQLSCLTRPEVFKPFFIILTFCLLQILSGSYIVIFYGVSLICSASGGGRNDIKNLTVAVLSALVRFVVSIITAISLLRLGRRKIGIISGVGTALACFLLVGYLQLKQSRTVQLDSHMDIVIISSLIMVYVALNTFGIFGLPCMMIGEVLPSRVRGFVSGVLLMLINLIIFYTTKVYPQIAKLLGPSGVFLTFGIVAVATTVFIYLFLPETKDRPLTQIEQYFSTGKNYLWASRDKSLMAKNNAMFL